MTQFRKQSIIFGWAVFAISFIVYALTLEPVASLWDCSEFIATSYKLEVGHPPGTPLFFLINRIGVMFASSPESVGYAINMLSALESALTIAFLFWTIANLARKIYRKTSKELTSSQVYSTMIAATIGSLAYAFTDTFWFSAVEAEVYALSSLFTAVVFWAMLRWERVSDKPGANRWLVFIAYLMGLSIGAHILNLLTIPALVFIFYFKKFPHRPLTKLWIPLVVAFALTGIFYQLTPTVVKIGAWVDRVFVNSFSAPVNSGLAFFIVVILAALAYGVYYTVKKKKEVLNIIYMSLIMVVIGFSTYGVVLIRSSVNPPMNSNQPDNPYALLQFLNREQYGSRPLIFGQSYASTTKVDQEKWQYVYNYNDSYYIGDDGKYKPYSYVTSAEYDPTTTMFFPRMYSSSHTRDYQSLVNIKGQKVINEMGQSITVPTFGENLEFFFSYQLNHMYWRYFMWNFVGRQTDAQNDGPTNGNWLSGITFVDELFFGPQSDLPDSLANNKGRNTYYFLPLILGLIGFFFSLKRDGKGFLIISLLFFMTGIAIILYLNQTPSQARERDYAYAASFYAFCIWIGLGAMSLYESFKKYKAKDNVALISSLILCSSVPLILVTQNWDDHDRSGRTVARDMGFNYLYSTVLPNSILINYGDNDTFPVWYAQEVEGMRTDVKPMNASYISGDWYVDQMRIKSNDSEALPITIPRSKYNKTRGTPQFIVEERAHPRGRVWTLKEVMEYINSDNPVTKWEDGETDVIPARRIAIPVNKENALRSGIVAEKDAHLMQDTIFMNLKGNTLYIADVVLMDIISSSDWSRPLYFTSPEQQLSYVLGLGGTNSNGTQFTHIQNDGVAYRLTPIRTTTTDYARGRIDTEILYDNLMNNFSYGGFKDGAYADEFSRNTITNSQLRTTFSRLANGLMEEGDTTRAIEVLDRAMEEIPIEAFGYDAQIIQIIESYWRSGENERGDEIAMDYLDELFSAFSYYIRFTGRNSSSVERNIQECYDYIDYLYNLAGYYGRTPVLKMVDDILASSEEENAAIEEAILMEGTVL